MKLHTLPITLRQLQYVCAVAQELSFSRAAVRCGVSQPSLSAQIAEVERMLDVTLFERSRRGVLITPAGQDLVGRARMVLLAAEDLLEAARQHTDPLTGPLRLGIIPTLAPYMLPDIDPALRKTFKALEPRWIENKTEVLVEMLRQGELDAALLALEADLGALEHAAIGMDEFVVAACPDHPLGQTSAPVDPDALRQHRVMLLDDGHCFRDQALDVCGLVGAGEHGFRATSLTTLVQMTAAGQCVTILPNMAVEIENRRQQLTVRRFSSPAPRRTIVLAWRPGSPSTEALQQLAKVAQKAYQA